MSLDIANYRILERVGTGQGSTIYKAKSLSTGGLYAIKHVKVHSPEETRLIDQMRDEHACGSVLDHPALRKTFELRVIRRRLRNITAGLLFMEWIEGEPLSECAARFGLGELLSLFEQAADGLAAMHRGGFVHADLKPGNMLVTADGLVRLIDFGQSSPLNQPKIRVQGTFDYMAPEQAALQVLDARTDVFGLGATLHRLLTGKAVATEMNQTLDPRSLHGLGMRVADNQAPSLDNLPPPVSKLINDCCAKDPTRRPRDMREFIERCGMARVIIARRGNVDEVITPG